MLLTGDVHCIVQGVSEILGIVSLHVVKTYAAFTNHAFVLRETVAVARLLTEGASWDEVRSSIVHDNLFSLRSEASRKTMFGAMKARLQHAPDCLLEHLSSGDLELQTATNLFLILLQHALLREFIADVILEHQRRLLHTVAESDIVAWCDRKHQLEPSLEHWTDATVNKARVNMVAMCVDGNLLVKHPTEASYDIRQNFLPAAFKRDVQALGFAHYLPLLLDAMGDEQL